MSSASRSLVFELHAAQRQANNTSRPKSSDFEKTSVQATQRSLRSKHTSYPAELTNSHDLEYHLSIKVGTPCRKSEDAHVFRVTPDTGSQTFWIPIVHCSTQGCSQSSSFNLTESCTARPLGYRSHVKYVDGSVAYGSAYEDDIQVGEIIVSNQTLLQVDVDQESSLDPVVGVLGLARYGVNNTKFEDAFIERFFSEHTEIPAMFSFMFSGQGSGSKMIFGDPEVENYAKEPLLYGKSHYATHFNLWLTSVYSIGFAGTGVEKIFSSAGVVGAPALVDSGTSLMLLTPDIWDDFMSHLSGYFPSCTVHYSSLATMVCQCPSASVFDRIPALVINIIDEDEKERPLCMSPQEYIVASFDSNTNATTCTPSISRGHTKQPFPFVFGLTFMRSFFTSFDIERQRIGFARSIMSPLPANTFCTVHNSTQTAAWIASLAFISVAVVFAIYASCCGDINACCGWPTCRTSEPCKCERVTYESMGPIQAAEFPIEEADSNIFAELLEKRISALGTGAGPCLSLRSDGMDREVSRTLALLE